jgi:hypothetical protein
MRIFLLYALLFFLFSCKKQSQSVDMNHDYFPNMKGYFVEYEVMSIKHDDLSNVHDTLIYKMKTVVGDTVIDNEGRIANKYYRYYFDTIYQKYKLVDLWTIIIDNERGELVEENQRKIKLVFPPTKSKEWDVNAFNDNAPIMVYYSNIHKPFQLNDLNFQSSIKVEEDSVYNLIQYKRKYEVYAKGVGLIKKHFQDFEINNFDYTNPLKGSELFYSAISYGKQ